MPLPFPSIRDLFDGVPEPEARRILSFCPERRYRRDGVIFYEGGTADALFIVRSGLVKLVALSPKGTETILHILRPDDVFGETCFAGGTRPFTAVALTDALLLALPRTRFAELLETEPAFGRGVRRMLAGRLREVEREFASRISAWAHHRLAHELLHLSRDLGVETPRGTVIDLHLTHEDLANLIGTTRETVTLLIHKFEEMGLLRREGRRIIVRRGRLAEYAAGDGAPEENAPIP